MFCRHYIDIICRLFLAAADVADKEIKTLPSGMYDKGGNKKWCVWFKTYAKCRINRQLNTAVEIKGLLVVSGIFPSPGARP